MTIEVQAFPRLQYGILIWHHKSTSNNSKKCNILNIKQKIESITKNLIIITKNNIRT